MRRLVLACLVAGSTACGTKDPAEGDAGELSWDAGLLDGGREPSGSSVRLDGGVDAHVSSRRDASFANFDAGFEQCAAMRTEADNKPLGANVVWVIDTSTSMDKEAVLVQQNLNQFVQVIAAAGLPDYRAVVVSKRSFVGVPDPLNSDSTHFKYVEEEVDSAEPLADLVARFPDYGPFLLPDVTTHFVVVTDDDSRNMTAREFRTQMTAQLGANFRVHTIGSSPEDGVVDGVSLGIGCRGSYGSAMHSGDEYWLLAKLTRGLTYSICTQDWSTLFTMLAQATIETTPVSCVMALPTAPPGKLLNLDDVEVQYTPPGGPAQALTRVEGPDSCGDTGTWFYAYERPEDADPSYVQLCQDACDLTITGGSLKVELSCYSVAQ